MPKMTAGGWSTCGCGPWIAKTGWMNPPKSRRQSVSPAANSIPFNSRLKPYINDLLIKRYIDEKPIDAVLNWLDEQGCKISLRSYHEFLARLLARLPVAQAQAMGVDVLLLRAIRLRLKLPTDPRGKGSRAKRIISRYDSRHQHRPLTLSASPRRPTPPVPRSQQNVNVTKDQPISTRVVLEPSFVEIKEFERMPRMEMYALNIVAIRKIRAINRNVITNHFGVCKDIGTLDDYSVEDLQQKFGLTYAEARTCFITIDRPG